jgi:ABC-type branched-subunit amino acid transport system substrate-binding protein
LAWQTYYNTVVAPQEHLRQAKLIWYDDSLDPQRTLQYVQRLHDVDKVLYLAGVTSPEAISAYLEQTKFPMIGDIGLSPKSWTNKYIFPTTPSDATRNSIRIKVAADRFKIKNFAVIQDVLPSVDTTPIKASWKTAADRSHVNEVDYVEISSTASDCSAQFARVIQSQPEYIILPTASGVMLACLREGKKFSVQPNGGNSRWLKGWSGGSNLQIEVDSCKPSCEGMYSIGTVFSDPRVANTPQMQIYRSNMAKYAPNVDITGFIAINYYHAGYLFYSLVKAAGITNNLTRATIVNAAEHFGPFDTGFGNTVQWTSALPHEPWTCGYPVVVKGDHWVFDSQKYCL